MKLQDPKLTVMTSVNRVILKVEELYSNGLITREQADRRIKNARSVGEFLLAERKEVNVSEYLPDIIQTSKRDG